ncbi:hypothetical protein E2C01_038069 [Portunus trituberculatus]|uniref:Uncharacterized protein n=1 Tax=Portunus trituberculatus TaxID=210409 RepID=A0A5B7FFT3_PORTR|nr:hypothetical protein [Portunus trituberculatus]
MITLVLIPSHYTPAGATALLSSVGPTTPILPPNFPTFVRAGAEVANSRHSPASWLCCGETKAGHSWANRCTDICVRSSAMATIDISCKGCEFDYWEIIAPAIPVEYRELNNNREENQPGPSSFR